MTALSSLYRQRGKISFRSGAVCPHSRFHSGAARPCGRIRPAVRRARRQAPGVYRNSADYTKEALIKSATADVERFFGGLRFEKRRNTLCISSFSNRKADEKDPTTATGDLFRDSLIKSAILIGYSVHRNPAWHDKRPRPAKHGKNWQTAKKERRPRAPLRF